MKIFVFLLFLSFVSFCYAKTVPFRSGEIYFAETSTFKPEITNWNNDLFGTDINSVSLWAAVTVKIHPGRKISIFDYNLEFNGVNYQCAAIRTNNRGYVYTKDAISAEKDTFYTLLFMLNGATVKKDQKASLVSPFPASKNDIPERFNIKDHGDLPPCPYDYIIVYKEGQF